MTLSSKTVKELRKIAREEGIRTSGRKAVLVDRLERHMAGERVAKGRKKSGSYSGHRNYGRRIREGDVYKVSTTPVSWAQMSRNRADPFGSKHADVETIENISNKPYFNGSASPAFMYMQPRALDRFGIQLVNHF